ncbi:MAG: Crp/Fnr family transcriptional regulator [Marinibacterium sp.]
MSALSETLPDYLGIALGDAVAVRRLGKGETLFRTGEPVSDIFFVLEGEVKAARFLPDGTEVVMMRAGAGEYFAESALAAPRFSCDAMCIKPARVAVLPVADVNAALAHPDFARAFVMAVAGYSRRQCSRYERLRLRSARDRVLHMILCESDPDGRLDWALPLSELATELSLDPETLYRVLRELERTGRIRRDKRRLELVP